MKEAWWLSSLFSLVLCPFISSKAAAPLSLASLLVLLLEFCSFWFWMNLKLVGFSPLPAWIPKCLNKKLTLGSCSCSRSPLRILPRKGIFIQLVGSQIWLSYEQIRSVFGIVRKMILTYCLVVQYLWVLFMILIGYLFILILWECPLSQSNPSTTRLLFGVWLWVTCIF